MGASTMSDFALGSNGHCFVCLNKIMELQPDPNISAPLAKQINSLQYLTRYLKMDLRKVFIDKGQVSSELLDKVEKARLKVELCEDCRYLSERFSKIYRQLEKLELELVSTLSLIHEKLSSADVTPKLHGLTSGLNSNWKGSLEVLDVLRAEAIEKGSYKLSVTPLVKIQRLAKAEVSAKQFVPKSEDDGSQMAKNEDIASCHRVETSGVKTESLNDVSLSVSENDNGNYFSEDTNSSLDNESMNGNLEMESNLNADDNTKKRNMVSYKEVASRTSRNVVGTGKCSIDPETGKRTCNDCSKEFNSSPAFILHYQTVHLKLRYKCVACNKLFSRKGSLTLHQRTSRSCSVTESAPKFKCPLCERSFSLKQHLQTHLDGVHLKILKYECGTCKKKFMTKVALFKHRRQAHRGDDNGMK